MILKILGVIDLLIVISLITLEFIPPIILTIFGIYLLIKSLFFIITGDKLSIIEFLCGIYLILASNEISHWVITIIFALYILQKGFISIFS